MKDFLFAYSNDFTSQWVRDFRKIYQQIFNFKIQVEITDLYIYSAFSCYLDFPSRMTTYGRKLFRHSGKKLQNHSRFIQNYKNLNI